MSEQFFQNSDAQNEAEAKAKAEEVQRQQEQNPFFMDDDELKKDRYYSMYSGDDLIYGESIKLEFTLPRLLRSTRRLARAKGSVGKSMFAYKQCLVLLLDWICLVFGRVNRSKTIADIKTQVGQKRIQ